MSNGVSLLSRGEFHQRSYPGCRWRRVGGGEAVRL